ILSQRLSSTPASPFSAERELPCSLPVVSANVPAGKRRRMESSAVGIPGQRVSSTATDLKLAMCPLCGSQNSKALFTQRMHTLMHCEGCDLSFIHPYPKEVQRHYEAVSDNAYDDLEVVQCATQYNNEKLFYARYFDLIHRECAGASSILDVGCGCGYLLERLAQYPQLARAGIELKHEGAGLARTATRCTTPQR